WLIATTPRESQSPTATRRQRQHATQSSNTTSWGATSMLVALVVEDNVALRSAVARYLERKGWQIVSAANGLQGLEAVRRRSFDVVISAVNMPGRVGLSLWVSEAALRP